MDKIYIPLNAYERKIYSQYGEDGIIMEIFRRIGTKNKTLVEIAPGDGVECMAKNLLVNLGWRGLLVDRKEIAVKNAKHHFKFLLGERYKETKIIQAWVTKENVNAILEKNGITGEIDLLVIDIDGNDWWVWKEIKVIQPRVVVIEYNAFFGCKKAVTIKYNPNFVWEDAPDRQYYGASLPAMTMLGKKKGYILVGGESHGVNCFFVRKEIAQNKFMELTPEEAYCSHLGQPVDPPRIFKQLKDLGLELEYVNI